MLIKGLKVVSEGAVCHLRKSRVTANARILRWMEVSIFTRAGGGLCGYR